MWFTRMGGSSFFGNPLFGADVEGKPQGKHPCVRYPSCVETSPYFAVFWLTNVIVVGCCILFDVFILFEHLVCLLQDMNKWFMFNAAFWAASLCSRRTS